MVEDKEPRTEGSQGEDVKKGGEVKRSFRVGGHWARRECGLWNIGNRTFLKGAKWKIW